MSASETIIGHFFICCLPVLLTRLLQIHILKDKYGTEETFDFIRDFRVAKVSERKYINLTRISFTYLNEKENPAEVQGFEKA